MTGAAGFIGSNFVKFLLDKYDDYRVIVLDSLTYAGSLENLPIKPQNEDRLEFWYGDVCNPEIVNALVGRSNMVVHFAAESHVARSIFDNAVFYRTDVLGTQTIANAIVKNPQIERFIHVSTSEVYGTALQEPMNEDHPLNPLSPYASAKCGADRLVYSYYATYQIPATIVRPFNNFGRNQHLEKVVPRFITSAIMEEPLTVHGDGGAARDWLYVQDNCEAIDAVLHAPLDKVKGEVFNIGTSRSISVSEIAAMVLNIIGKPDDLISYIGDRPGQVQCHIADASKLERAVGWKPRTRFEDGVAKTAEWYSQNRPWWEKQLWMKSVPIKTADGHTEFH